MVVSFTFGVKGAGDVIHSAALAAPGLVILVTGIFGIALNGQVSTRRHETQGAISGLGSATKPSPFLWAQRAIMAMLAHTRGCCHSSSALPCST